MMNRRSFFWGLVATIAAMFSGCEKELPKEGELKSFYLAHRQTFGRIVAMLDEDGAFIRAARSQNAALLLNPLGPSDSRDLAFSKNRIEQYQKCFDEIGRRSPALVFGQPNAVIFVAASKGLAIGGGGTTRGIAYMAHPEQNAGFRIVSSEQEAENSTYGGADLVPIEGNWYLYFLNPS